MENYDIIWKVIGSTGILGILAGLGVILFRTGKIVQKIQDIDISIVDIKKDLRCIENRLSHLEGRLDERTRWESRRV